MKMIPVLKEEMNTHLKEIYENTNKQWEKMNKTIQDLEAEIESERKYKLKEIW